MIRLADSIIQMGNWCFNYFLVGKKEAALLECGVTGSVESFKAEWELLQDKPSIKYLIIMHEHFDHVCGAPSLKKMFPDATVLAHPAVGRYLCKPGIIDDYIDQDMKMADVLLGKGILDHLPSFPVSITIKPDAYLVPDEVLVLDNIELKILETPGHSPGSVSVYVEKEKAMFPSDACGFQINPGMLFPVFFQSFEMYLESIHRLMGYETCIMGLPHGKVWRARAARQFYHHALGEAWEAFSFIEKMLDKESDKQVIEEILFKRYYRDDLLIYTPENITQCVKLLHRRVQEVL